MICDPVRLRRLDGFHLRRRRGREPEADHAHRDRLGHVARDRRLRDHQHRVLSRAGARGGRRLRGGGHRDRSPAAWRLGRARPGGARRRLHVRHHERRHPDRAARHAGDGGGRPALEAARGARPQARDALAGALGPGRARLHLALRGERVRRRLGLVRHHVVDVLRPHHGRALRAAPAGIARRDRGAVLSHPALPVHADPLHPRHGRDHLQRLHHQRAAEDRRLWRAARRVAGGRAARRARRARFPDGIPRVLDLEGPPRRENR